MRLELVATATFVVTVLLTWSAQAQHQIPGHRPAAMAPNGLIAGPFDLRIYGAFRNMMRQQDFAPKVQLKTVMKSGATKAVGAAAGLRGEITVIDGKLLLTYGKPCATCGHPGKDHATLLATAKVSAWQRPVALPRGLAGHILDAFIIEQARTRGLDLSKPFPIRMKGTLTSVKMHVIRGANPAFKGHSSGHPMAHMNRITAEQIDGEIVAFYAPANLQGIITHPHKPFHYHWVDAGRTRTAHLDAFGMAAGAQLLLPAR